MNKDDPSRKLTVILHADVVGSTALVQKHEVLAHNRIQSTFRNFAKTIASYGGTTCELRGDALVAEFDRASDAVTAAIEFQAQNEALNAQLEDEVKPSMRIGISLGEVIVADNTITGAGVVLAQRLEQLADPGGVVVQGSVSETVPDRMPFEFEFMGEQKLKGFEKSVRAFRVHPSNDEALPGSGQELPPGLNEAEDFKALKMFFPESYEELIGEKLRERNVPSIAVLPFENMSNDAEQEYFADGISEDIITKLSLVPELIVIARNSTFVYKGRSVDVRQVGRELGVNHVLEGSIRKSGNRIRVTAQLVKTDSGDHLWAERFDRMLDDIFEIQDEITHKIVIELQVNIGRGELVRLAAAGTRSVEAWELVMRAARLMEGNSREDIPIALKLVGQAIEIDGSFSSAWVTKGWIYWHQSVFGWSSDAEQSLQESLNAVQKAISVDSNNPEAYSLLGNIYMVQGETQQALAMCEKAVEIAPGNSNSMAVLANVLIDSGEIDEGIKRIKRAIQLCPYPPGWYFVLLGVGLHLSANNELAVPVLKLAIERDSELYMARVWLASALVELEKLDEAQELRNAVIEIKPEFSAAGCAKSYRSNSHARLQGNLIAAGFPE